MRRYREVLILKFLEEKDYKEISDILEKPMGTVATLISRAKKQFREKTEQAMINNFNILI
jgi:RNA polymerase sigma-70 factor (ECF subfamily)